MVDADHGFGNALSVRRTVLELEAAGAAGLTIEDTLLPQAYGEAKPQLVSREEGLGKIRAALGARSDPDFVIVGRTGAASITDLDDAIARALAYEEAGVDALFFTGLKTIADLEAVSSQTSIPIIIGSPTPELSDWDYLASRRVRVAVTGHAPMAAAIQAVFGAMKALRDGTPPAELPGLASKDLSDWVMRAADASERAADFLGIERK